MDRDNASTATQADHGLTRRGVMRKTAIGIGATATIGGGSLTLENGPVQESEAVAPLLAVGAIGASVAVGWALREFEVLGSDPPAEGLTAGALTDQIYQTALTRESENAGTIVDNRNILDGVQHTAYVEAKISAIEALNAGKTESDVLAAANASLLSYEKTVLGNMIGTWNQTLKEADNSLQAVASHSELGFPDSIDVGKANSGISLAGADGISGWSLVDDTHTFDDGTTKAMKRVDAKVGELGGSGFEYLEIGLGSYDTGSALTMEPYIYATNTDGDLVKFADARDWGPLYTDMNTTFQNVRDGISTWVTSVYADVQSGEIEISDLVTPRERAAMMTEDGKYPQAVADLIALNVPVDLEREATVTIPSTGTTLRGTFALTDSADGPLESGTTYDPSTFAGDAYLTTDISLLEGTWSAYQTAVDGGIITLSEEPYSGTIYEVETTAGEIVSVPAADWTDSGSGTWTYDASGDLETPITEVASVSYYAETSETQYETIQLDSPFTINKFTNTETGEEVQSTTFTNSEPQTDSNYITQEEWDSLEKQNQELIEKYEESQNSGGGGGGLLGGGLFQDTKTLGMVAGGAALAALLFGNN